MSEIYFLATNESDGCVIFDYSEIFDYHQCITGFNIIKNEYSMIYDIVTDIKNVFALLNFECVYLRELKFADELIDKRDIYYFPKRFILGEGMNLSNVKTFQYLISLGADISTYDYHAAKWAVENEYLEIISLLINNGADIAVHNNYLIRCASQNGSDYFDLVEISRNPKK